MFQPVLIGPGIAGWEFLKSTYDRQFDAFTKSPQLKRDTDYFREKIASVTSAEDLVQDRRLLSVALGAFGLQDDINNTFFIRKMLEEGTTAEDALANRFTDSRYRDFSAAFGLGPGELRGNLQSTFADDIIQRFEAQSFEVAAGEQDETVRIALYAQRTLDEVVGGESSERAKWFEIMGTPPLRTLFETALNLPSEFSQIDLDQQLETFQDRTRAIFGETNPSQFADAEKREDLITQYVARSQIAQLSSGFSSTAIALTLLQGS